CRTTTGTTCGRSICRLSSSAFWVEGERGRTDVPDRNRLPVRKTNHLPPSTQNALDESRQIDLPHVVPVVVRHDNGEILGQHHQHSQVAMINVLVGHKDRIQRWELCW